MVKRIITKKEVQKVADLARIKLTVAEKDRFAQNLNDVLSYFADLKEVDTEKVKKVDHYALAKNQLRADVAKPKEEDEKERIRKLFPERKDNYLKVKEVLNGSH